MTTGDKIMVGVFWFLAAGLLHIGYVSMGVWCAGVAAYAYAETWRKQ